MKTAIQAAIVALLITTWNLPILVASPALQEQSPSKATETTWKKAEAGDAQAQYELGENYRLGRGVAQDYAEAAKWYRKAAEQGIASAQFNLGLQYDQGRWVKQDYAEAAKWYQKADEQGDAHAQVNLAIKYWRGEGIRQDFVEAYRWLNEAAAQGLATAAEQWEILESRMTREQIAEAQRLSRNFVPRKPGQPPPADSQPKSSGTGFFITSDGYLITCNHVVDGASQLRVVGPAGTKDARLVQSDAANDIALLKVGGNFAALAVQPSRGVRMGDSVATVGFPNPGLQGFAPKFSKGEISALTGVKDDPRLF